MPKLNVYLPDELAAAVKDAQVPVSAICQSALERAVRVASMGPPAGAVEGHIPFTPLAKRALEATAKEALSMVHNYIGCEHLLLGLLATEEGLASQVLRRMGVELRTTRRATTTAL